jgi:hypothetical protein
MENLPAFLSYARDFEKTLRDDDWTRLVQYFAADAVYDIEISEYGSHIVGRDAIFRGIKKSLDGFDRKFDGRDVQVTSPPEMDGEWMKMSWVVTYKKADKEPFPLRGASRVLYRDGKIAHLVDSYGPGVVDEIRTWMRDNQMKLDLSYT